MVKVVNIVRAQSTSHINACASIAEMESETNSRSVATSFNASITEDELDSTVHFPTFRSVVVWHAAYMMLYVRLALFIHGIMSAKRTCEVQPAVLVRESSTQLLCIRWIHASDTLHT